MNSQLESATFRKIADPEMLVSIYQHAQYNARKQHRREITANERAKKDVMMQKYAENQKKNQPKKSGMIIATAPRSKITARKAKKALMNNKKK